ncbi:serine hydrolase domain-containing protein [Pacificoceanicola onchidii]|uniref:serine hydrolase domain-containing protein n=1 Tax=Pacificoceanicola onchidii TaxID=2562685 RepID=UPI0010A66202|nr:serine hydrolase domain-containing protein [Pacificoceanicola onchidii]
MTWLLRGVALLSICCVLLPGPGFADRQTEGDRVQALLETFRAQYGFPGVTVAYVSVDGRVETHATGFADVEAGIAMTEDHRMLAASIGKTVWGALVLALEAEGVLARSDRVSAHLEPYPWFARVPNAKPMTVGQLLTHTAGLPDHVHMAKSATALIALGEETPVDPADLVAFVLDEPPLFAPGTAWSYSDTGYILLGMVLEAATGRAAYTLAQERFLDPLGLNTFVPSDTPTIKMLAVGYTAEDNAFGLAPRTMDHAGRLIWNPAIEWTGGGFATTSRDLALWGHALFTGQAIEAAYLEDLVEGVPVHPDAPGVFYGGGVARYLDTPFGQVYGHGGWIPGYVSSLRHYADHGLTIAFQINSDVGIPDESSDLVPALEAALAELLISALE